MKKIDWYHLRPDVFVKESLDFMEGYWPKWKIWLYMPIAYIKVCYYTVFQ